MIDPRTQLVGRGYDAIVETWEAWAAQVTDDPRGDWAADLARRLPRGARVLELGCGGGTSETKAFATRFRLTGIDLSTRQLERARARVPEAAFLQADLTAVDLEPASFDAVVAFYSLNHVPRELLAPLFASIHRWLARPGWFMAALGASDLEGWTGEFLGAPTYFSGFEPETNRRLLREAGLQLVRDEVVTITEPEGAVTFHWILAQT